MGMKLFRSVKTLLQETVKEAIKPPQKTPKKDVSKITDEEVMQDSDLQDDQVEENEETEMIADDYRDEALAILDDATKNWKETGKMGVTFDTPKLQWKTRLNKTLTKLKNAKLPKFKKTIVVKNPPIKGEISLKDTWQDLNLRLNTVSENTQRSEIDTLLEELE